MGSFKLFRLLKTENLRALNHRRAELKQAQIDKHAKRKSKTKDFDKKFREAMNG